MLSFFEKHDFGFVPDPEQDRDPRNLLYEDLAPMGGEETLPESVDIFPSPYTNLNQGRTAACTCFSFAHEYELQTGERISPRYAFTKIKTDSKYKSSELPWGAYMIDAIKLIVNEGIQLYNEAYDAKDTHSDAAFIKMPLESQRIVKGGSYLYVTNSNDNLERWKQICRFLAYEQRPVRIGMTWTKSMNNARNGGVVPAVTPTGSASGHAMTATAYKHINGELYVGCENSWGEGWGDKGRIWLPARFVKVSSGIAYLPPQKTVEKEIKKPEPVVTRDVELEKLKAKELRKLIYEKFPMVGKAEPNANNVAARSLAGRSWLLLVQAVTYRGWTYTDVINWLYAQSRGKKNTKAYSLDFTKHKFRVIHLQTKKRPTKR
jgi:hypothetical protein